MFRFGLSRQTTISRQMLLWFLCAALAPLAVATFAFDAISARAVRRDALAHLDALAESKASQLETYANERKADARALARRLSTVDAIKQLAALWIRPGRESPEYAAAEDKLRQYFMVYPQVFGCYTNVFLASPSGDELFELVEHGQQRTNYLAGPYRDTELARSFEQARTTRKLAFSRFAPFARSGDAVVFIAVPVFDGDAFLGVAILEVGASDIYKMVNNYSGLGDTGEIVVGSLEGDTVTVAAPTRYDAQAAFRRTISLEAPAASRYKTEAYGPTGHGIGLDYRGVETVAAWRYLPSWQWGMVVKIDASEVFALMVKERRWGFFLGAATLLLVAGLAVWAASSFSKPIAQLTAAAQRMSQGDLSAQVPVERRDEIGELGQTFNKMSADLKAIYATIEEQVQQRTRELREQEERFRQLAENIHEVFWLVAADTREFVYVSPAFEHIWGRSSAKLYASPESWFDAIHPDDQERVRETWRQAVAAEQEFESEYRLTRPDGEIRWIFDRGFPVHDSTGKLYRLAGIAEDVTERKTDEDSLRRQASLLNLTHDAIFVRDMESHIAFWNHGAEECYGWAAAEALGRTTHVLLKTRFPKPLEEIVAEVETQNRWDGELVHTTRDGKEIVMASRWSLERDENGKPKSILELNTDVTERKRAEQAMARAREAAEEADRVKSDFLLNISHEIRTPMNGIIGLAGLALDTPLSDEQRGYLDGVMLSAESLLQMINAILDFSRLQEGGLELEKTSFQLRESLASTIETLETRAREKGLVMSHEIRPDVPDDLLGDAARLWQVIVNIVGNAIKFTQEGSVSLLVENETITPESVTLRFSVSDTGIGIPADKREAILLPFVQVDTSKKRKYGGAGLGLSVSSRLIELMGGRLWFESEPGKGSTFHFTACFGRPAPSAAAPTAAAAAEEKAEDRAANEARAALMQRGPLRILVAEDNPINQKLIVRLLQKEGHAVSVANNGEEALAAVARQEFDLVLMDVQMPVIDGFEATAELRRQELRSERHLPIVALTAHAMRGDREKCLEAGMDGYVAKPIRQEELLIAMAAAVGAAAGRELAHAAAPGRESNRQECAMPQDQERNDAR